MRGDVIAIIGTGGTGGNLVSLVARMLSATYLDTTLLLVDGDSVEEKNLKRQPFSKRDIGMNKARALAKKVEATYDCKVEYSSNYVLSIEDMDTLFEKHRNPIIIGCVDNHKCRKVLHDWFEKAKNCIYIDVANEDTWGDCFVSFKISDEKLFKTRGDMFPEVLLDSNKSVVEMSCEELSNVSPQFLKTNSMAANIVFNALDSILVKNRLPFYYSSFDLESLSITSKFVDDYNDQPLSEIVNIIHGATRNAA